MGLRALCTPPPDTADEQWRNVPGFSGYQASTLGRVRSLKGRTSRLLKGSLLKSGYYSVHLYNDDRRVHRPVHILVTTAFHGARPAGLEVRHLDGDSTNNRPTNLAWGTHVENNQDRVKHGTHHHAAKTECDFGHPFDETNTYVRPDGKGRQCRACCRRRGRERRGV